MTSLHLMQLVLSQVVLDGPAPSTSGKIFEGVFSPGVLPSLLTVVLGIIGALLGSKAIWKRRIALAAYHCYHIVEDVADDNTQAGLATDKPKLFLQQLDAYFAANGWRPLKPDDKMLAQYQAQSLSGQSVAAATLAAAAAVPAGAVVAPVAVLRPVTPAAIVPPPPAP